MFGGFLWEPVTEVESSQCENPRLLAAASSMQGWREEMQDRHCHHLSLPQDPNACYFGVFDGYDGSMVAQHAADHLHEFVTKRPEYRNGSIQRAFELGFLDFDATVRTDFVSKLPSEFEKRVTEIKKRLRELEKLEDDQAEEEKHRLDIEMILKEINRRDSNPKAFEKTILDRIGGSTANIVFIKDDNIYCANLGDSRAVASVEGRLLELSKDHRPKNADEKEIARIKAAGGRINVYKNVVDSSSMTRAFGIYLSKRCPHKPPELQSIIALPEVRMHKLTPGWEFVLLATDGLWGCMESQEAVSFVRERIGRGERPRAITEALVRHCLDDPLGGPFHGGAGRDNVTALLVCFLPYEQLIRQCRTAPKPEHGQTENRTLTPS